MKREVYTILAEKYSSISESVAEELDSLLQAANFPKSNYEAAEVFQIIDSYLSKFDPRDINEYVYRQIIMALKWNKIDTGLLEDYLSDKNGANSDHPQDPQSGDEVTEGNTATKEQVLHSVANLIENKPINGIEIQTHYGNFILPVVEIWDQDGTLKISVDQTALEKQNQ